MQFINSIPNFQEPQLFIISICINLMKIFFILTTIIIIGFFITSIIKNTDLKKLLFIGFIGINIVSIIIYLIMLIASKQLSFLVLGVPFYTSNIFIYKLMQLDINQRGGK